MMRTGRALVFAVICEMAGKTSRYADVIRRCADRAEYWAATHLRKAQLDQPDMCH